MHSRPISHLLEKEYPRDQISCAWYQVVANLVIHLGLGSPSSPYRPFSFTPAPLSLHSWKKQGHINWFQALLSEEPQLGAVFSVQAITMWTY